MILEIANDIEEVLKKEELVGQRIGSGFCFFGQFQRCSV